MDIVLHDITQGTEPKAVPLLTSDGNVDILRDLEEVFIQYTPILISDEKHQSESNSKELHGCSCDSNCEMDCECVDSHGYFYDKDARLLIDALPPLHAMYECSSLCDCSAQACKNRTTQSGIKLDLEVRGSQGGHGLGLFTRQDIPKGCFICIYAGEIIRQDEARRRWEQRAKNSAGNYTLVIREESGSSIWKTIVDPTHRGNVGRFINHACPPLASLIILPVRPAGQMIPQPALFAGRDIVRGEELSFDYADASGILWTETGSNSRQEELGHKTLTKCLCGSSRCRGYMPFEPDL